MLSRAEIELGAQESVEALSTDLACVNGTQRINVMFDMEYIDPFGVESSSPAVTFVTSLWAAEHGDTLDIGAERFTVTNVRPDGAGITVVSLKKAI